MTSGDCQRSPSVRCIRISPRRSAPDGPAAYERVLDLCKRFEKSVCYDQSRLVRIGGRYRLGHWLPKIFTATNQEIFPFGESLERTLRSP